MPNAQTHLAAVCALLARPPIQAAFRWLADEQARAAFLLGAISPDVRALSGQAREETHFFVIPPDDPRPAQAVMLERWPALRDTSTLQRPHAAFVAGYITHLVMDQVWVEQVVMPALFINGQAWGTDHPGWRLYGILMTYLEYRASDRIPAGTLSTLAKAEPHNWLPFVSDYYLAAWRDRVVHVARAGGARRLSALFAGSSGMTADELEAIVLSDERMQAEAFSIVARERLVAFEREAEERSVGAVLEYLGHDAPAVPPHSIGKDQP